MRRRDLGSVWADELPNRLCRLDVRKAYTFPLTVHHGGRAAPGGRLF